MDDQYRYFRVEARELLDHLVKGVLALERGEQTNEVVASLLRHAHTLKGAARVVKQPEIADQAHVIEDVLAPFRNTTDVASASMLRDLLGLIDGISFQVASLDQAATDSDSTSVVDGSTGPGLPVSRAQTVRADVVEMDALVEGAREAHAVLSLIRDSSGIVERARSLAELAVQQLSPRGRGTDTTTPQRATMAHSITIELRNVLAMLERHLGDASTQLDRELRQVRDAAERLRLVPVSDLLTNLERAARDVAREQGKRIAFVAHGGDIRLDAHVVGATQAALHQIVRNAVAHGIEAETDRVATGKPSTGTIAIDIQRRGRRVLFRCRDDGRGVDLEAVRTVARRRGMTTDDTDQLDPAGLVNLLLKGGISTSSTVTELSGRGVGLDVVRDSAERLGAHVRVLTDAGSGTTVEFDTPLSLLALDVLVMQALDATVAIPVDAVVQATRIPAGEITTTPQGDSLVHDGRPVPYLALTDVLARTGSPPLHLASDSRPVVLIRSAAGSVAVGVDRLRGAANVVVRPLPDHLDADPTVAAVWLDADGNPQLLLDPEGLAEAAGHAREYGGAAVERPAPILVIDDSLTTRMLEQSILEGAGYEVELSASAEEGLAKAASTVYSLFLVDIEMPGMDGFAFVERTRVDPMLRNVPSILVSSRASAEDRRRGVEVGANAYIAKGEFDQHALLATIGRLIGEHPIVATASAGAQREGR